MIRRTTIIRLIRVTCCAVAAVGVLPARAAAQIYLGLDIPHRGTLEVSGGAAGSGGYNLGSASADETRNTGSGTGAFALFSASSQADPSAEAVCSVGLLSHPWQSLRQWIRR